MFKLDEGNKLGAPGVCFLCESTPTSGEFAVDTEIPFAPPTASHLRGSKYVCEKCVKELAKFLPQAESAVVLKKRITDLEENLLAYGTWAAEAPLNNGN